MKLKKITANSPLVVKEDGLTYKKVEDIFSVLIGIDDIYVIDDKEMLKGIISRRFLDSERPMDVRELIKDDPIAIVDNKYARSMADALFRDSIFINSVPVVDKSGKLLYLYIRLHPFIYKFAEETEIRTRDEYSHIIQRAVDNIKSRVGYEPYILTDILEYGGRLYDHLEKKIISLQELNVDRGTVLLAYIFDFNALETVSECIKKGVPYLVVNPTDGGRDSGITPFYRMDRTSFEVLERESYSNHPYFDAGDFCYLFQSLYLTENLPGAYVEIGTYKGDSARAVLSFMNKSGIKRRTFFLDTYEGFSYDAAKNSPDSLWNDTHKDTSMNFVKTRLEEFDGYELIRTNIITDEMPSKIKEIAVCNVDVDMYEAVGAALERVLPLIVSGGVIVAEDYGHTPNLYGAHLATDEFYLKHRDVLYGFYMQSGQFIMIKK